MHGSKKRETKKKYWRPVGKTIKFKCEDCYEYSEKMDKLAPYSTLVKVLLETFPNENRFELDFPTIDDDTVKSAIRILCDQDYYPTSFYNLEKIIYVYEKLQINLDKCKEVFLRIEQQVSYLEFIDFYLLVEKYIGSDILVERVINHFSSIFPVGKVNKNKEIFIKNIKQLFMDFKGIGKFMTLNGDYI